MRVREAFIVTVALAFVSCKGTEDYLDDLRTSTDDQGKLNLAVFDAGLLVHEGLTGLLDQDVLTVAQMGRGVAQAGRLVENDVGLCRADAVSLLTHLALRYPLAPIAEPFTIEKDGGKIALQNVETLQVEIGRLAIEREIDGLESQDRVVVDRSADRLKKLSSQDFGRDATAWRSWWERERPAVYAEVEGRCVGPVRTLGDVRYRGLRESRAVLEFLASVLANFDLPGLRDPMRRSIERVARQVVVFGIQKSMADTDPVVRTAAARAAGEVLDPSFGTAIHAQISRELDPDARAAFLRTLAAYPGRQTLAALLNALREQNRALQVTAHRVLVEISGQDFGLDPSLWMIWYEREGKTRWS